MSTPFNVTATANETAVTVLFDVSSSSSATQYSIAYRKAGSSAIFSRLSTMVNGGAISALDPNTEYEVRVYALRRNWFALESNCKCNNWRFTIPMCKRYEIKS